MRDFETIARLVNLRLMLAELPRMNLELRHQERLEAELEEELHRLTHETEPEE